MRGNEGEMERRAAGGPGLCIFVFQDKRQCWSLVAISGLFE